MLHRKIIVRFYCPEWSSFVGLNLRQQCMGKLFAKIKNAYFLQNEENVDFGKEFTKKKKNSESNCKIKLEIFWKLYKKIDFHAKMEQWKDKAGNPEDPPMTLVKRRQF
jgi:hypothetical protein